MGAPLHCAQACWRKILRGAVEAPSQQHHLVSAYGAHRAGPMGQVVAVWLQGQECRGSRADVSSGNVCSGRKELQTLKNKFSAAPKEQWGH